MSITRNFSSIKIFLILCFGLFPVFLKANDTIRLNENQFSIDFNKHLVISNLDAALINSAWPETKTHILLHNLCTLESPAVSIRAGEKIGIAIPGYSQVFSLYFTELPIINISTSHAVEDSFYVSAGFKLIEHNGNFIRSDIGIQLRGAWIQFLPKKSMEIEFWTDSTGAETEDFTLLGMVNDDDWNLQAMYNEPLRFRNKINHDLWRMINGLHYQHEEPEAVNGIRMKFAELFINNQYQGIYCVGEKVNRKQLKLKKYNGNIRGELYKGVSWEGGAVTFTNVPGFDNNSWFWGGFEYMHPEEVIDWSKLHALVDFVVNSSDETFFSQYENYFESGNLLDYFIFLNLIRASDNTGKNIFLAKYDADSRYFYVPWDLDGSFGTNWLGDYDYITDDILSNGLFNRLMNDCRPNGFRERLKNKWISLRTNVARRETLMALFYENYDYLNKNGAYEREKLAWPEFVYDSTGLQHIDNWITARLTYLDNKFTESCTSFLEEAEQAGSGNIEIYPNPASEKFIIDSPFSGSIKITIYNSLGQVVYQDILQPGINEIQADMLGKGLYSARLESDAQIQFKKLILQ